MPVSIASRANARYTRLAVVAALGAGVSLALAQPVPDPTGPAVPPAASASLPPAASAPTPAGSTSTEEPTEEAARDPDPRDLKLPIRGVTVGPIENEMHADHGYGSKACDQTMANVRAMGGTWVSLTPFGRIWDVHPSGVDWEFEADFQENKKAVEEAIHQAHARGLRVLLVPHLWVESGQWRGELELDSDERWERWAASYDEFVSVWAEVAEATRVDLFSVGVELGSWVTSSRAARFADTIQRVRDIYQGPLTYAANWDDAQQTVIWGQLDVIGINAFYPLTERTGASEREMTARADTIADQLENWIEPWDMPVLFTEVGYTARPDPALRPWEWPEELIEVRYDGQAQARAYRALLSAFLDRPWFAGFFVWRFYADPYDVSQEPHWGFSPLHKPAELVIRQAFAAHWASDGERALGWSLIPRPPQRIGVY